MRFRIRYGRFNRVLLGVMGLGPRWSYVEVGIHDLRVPMGWAFRGTIPRTSIGDARKRGRVWGSWGVHGWRGRWLVNGSSYGIVTLDIDPPVRAYVCGFPVRLRELSLSLEDPDGFLAAIGR